MALTKWFFKMSFNHWQGPRMRILRPLFLSTPWWSNTNQLFPNTVVNLYPAFLPCCTCGLPSPNLESLWAHNPWFHRSAFQLLVRSIFQEAPWALRHLFNGVSSLRRWPCHVACHPTFWNCWSFDHMYLHGVMAHWKTKRSNKPAKYGYRLVMQRSYGKSPFLIGRSSNNIYKWSIFHGYVK